MTDDSHGPADETQIETELPRAAITGQVVQLVPRQAQASVDEVHNFTVDVLEKLLAQAKAGELHCVVAIAWHHDGPPHIHMSTDDRIKALGAIRTMEHGLVRDWLDGRVAQ